MPINHGFKELLYWGPIKIYRRVVVLPLGTRGNPIPFALPSIERVVEIAANV